MSDIFISHDQTFTYLQQRSKFKCQNTSIRNQSDGLSPIFEPLNCWMLIEFNFMYLQPTKHKLMEPDLTLLSVCSNSTAHYLLVFSPQIQPPIVESSKEITIVII